MDLRPGTLLGGRYRLLKPLGEGAMGAVWAARNEAIDREVAIKAIHADLARRHADAIPRFLNEARICGSIRHPGIVDVLDLGQAEDGSPFLVMEMLRGETLESVIDRAGVTPLYLMRIVRDVARTIALAHARNVVHRDLKPANIFLHRDATGDLITKVLDFGVSKVVSAETSSATATSTGAILGSPAYMSPEQASGRGTLDGRSDVFALGIILFEGLTGRIPFDAPNTVALLIDIATKDVPRVDALVPAIPRDVADVIARATTRDRNARYSTAEAFADALDALLGAPGGETGFAPTLSVAVRRSPRAEGATERAVVSAPSMDASPGAVQAVGTATAARKATSSSKLAIVFAGAFVGIGLTLGGVFVGRAMLGGAPRPTSEPASPAAGRPTPGADVDEVPSVVPSGVAPPSDAPSVTPTPMEPKPPEPEASSGRAAPSATPSSTSTARAGTPVRSAPPPRRSPDAPGRAAEPVYGRFD